MQRPGKPITLAGDDLYLLKKEKMETLKTKRTKHTPEVIEDIRKLRGLGLTTSEIALKLDMTYDQILGAIRRNQMPHSERRLDTPDLYEEPPVEELLEHCIKGNELVRDFDPRQREVFPKFDTKRYVGIVFHGDWHFDHYKTDLRTLMNELEEIGKAEDVFYVFNGDSGDWADIRFAGYNMPSMIMPVHLRYKVLFHMVSKIKNLLAVVSGCHDDWLKNRGFFDIISALKDKANALGLPTYYLGYGGQINMTVGKILYRMAVYHKFAGESTVNDFHPCVKYLQQMDSTADIVAIAHRHDKTGIAYAHFQRLPRVYVRSGSHQYLTDYAWKEGFGGAIARAPMVILNPFKKQMIACPNYKEGLEQLRMLNANLPKDK